MNRDLISKAIVLLVSYREYTGDHRMANLCGEVVEALKAELAKPEQESTSKRMRDAGYTRRSKGWEKDTEPDVTLINEGDMAGEYVDTAEHELVGIVQRISIAGYPMADSTGVEWLTTVSSGTKLYTSEERVQKSDKSIHEIQRIGQEIEQELVAWATFDGEGNYDFRSYEGNENYREEYIKRNGEKYANWVKPLYAINEVTK
jgi:hypothetical protein